jgi:isoamylase
VNTVRRSSLALMLLLTGIALPGIAATQEIENAASDNPEYGARIDHGGWIHFGLYSPAATAVNLLLFDAQDAKLPSRVIPMQRNGDDWRIKIKGAEAKPGLYYMYQAKGSRELSLARQYGAMFNEEYPLSDPYAFQTEGVSYSRVFAATPFADNARSVYAGGGKSIVYDHSRDPFPGHVKINPENLIIYELHIQDYTARLDGLPKEQRGTLVGLAQGGLKTPGGLAAGLDHLTELGVTAVELMPVMEYDEETGNAPGRLNHWGYMTTNFFAPEARYGAKVGNEVVELKQLIKALHDRGIAVFLDVVYNHTAEGKPWVEGGRLATKCFNLLCLALPQVYHPTPDGRFITENTGAGNDVDFSGGTRYTKRLATDSLTLWYSVYGVDGFRFDLARILADGSSDAADWVDNDQHFAAAHLHAEPWDLAGQWYDFMDNFGRNFSNNRWAKWLGKYRDQARRFSKSELRDPRALKRLIEGYGSITDGFGAPASTKPWRSINFLAVHDGYTLRDCMFFTDTNGSQNCWSSNGDENLRREREKLLLGLLLTSNGVPLIMQGDEFGQTKSGARSQEDARNSYNYESASGDVSINNVNWIDWRLKDGDTSGLPNAPLYGPELFHWTKELIALRKQWSHFRRADFPEYISDAADDRGGPRNDGKFTYIWEGPAEGAPSQLAVIWWGKPGEPDLLVIYNEHWDPFRVTNLKDWSRGDWKVLGRSWFGDGADFCGPADWQTKCPDAGNEIEVKGRSMAILVSGND